jgi:hypothetical protein
MVAASGKNVKFLIDLINRADVKTLEEMLDSQCLNQESEDIRIDCINFCKSVWLEEEVIRAYCEDGYAESHNYWHPV